MIHYLLFFHQLILIADRNHLKVPACLSFPGTFPQVLLRNLERFFLLGFLVKFLTYFDSINLPLSFSATTTYRSSHTIFYYLCQQKKQCVRTRAYPFYLLGQSRSLIRFLESLWLNEILCQRIQRKGKRDKRIIYIIIVLYCKAGHNAGFQFYRPCAIG